MLRAPGTLTAVAPLLLLLLHWLPLMSCPHLRPHPGAPRQAPLLQAHLTSRCLLAPLLSGSLLALLPAALTYLWPRLSHLRALLLPPDPLARRVLRAPGTLTAVAPPLLLAHAVAPPALCCFCCCCL